MTVLVAFSEVLRASPGEGVRRAASAPVVRPSTTADVGWAFNYGGRESDGFSAVRELRDGGYVAVGSSRSYSADTWVVGLKPDGSVKWQWAYSGKGHAIFGREIQPTSDGGFIVAGGDGAGALTSADGWLMKLSAKGKRVWQKRYAGPSLDLLSGVCEAPGSTYIAAGGTYSFGAGLEDGWLVKVDVDGEVLWEKSYGGSGYDSFRSIHETARGNYIVAGFTDSFGSGARDAWLLLVDGDGNILWQETYGGKDADLAFDAVSTSDGGYLIVGQTSSGGKTDAWIAKIKESGGLAWQKSAKGQGYTRFGSVQESVGGEFVAAGYLRSHDGAYRAWLMSVDGRGRPAWQNTYAAIPSLSMPAVERTADGGLVLAVEARRSDGASSDAGVFRLDSTGHINAACPVNRETKVKIKKAKAKAQSSMAIEASTRSTVYSSPMRAKKSKAFPFDLCAP